MEFTKQKWEEEDSGCVNTIEPPKEDECDDDQLFNESRIWIGNIDISVAEYVVLKLAQKFGELDKFDYVYNKSGPNIGKPKGFCFITYKNSESAEQAIKELHGYKLKYRNLIVRLANQRSQQETPTHKLTHSSSKCSEVNEDKETQIASIEAKLELMESETPDCVKSKLTKSIPPPSLMDIVIPPHRVTHSRGMCSEVNEDEETQVASIEAKLESETPDCVESEPTESIPPPSLMDIIIPPPALMDLNFEFTQRSQNGNNSMHRSIHSVRSKPY